MIIGDCRIVTLLLFVDGIRYLYNVEESIIVVKKKKMKKGDNKNQEKGTKYSVVY